jgi:hypothetical protein
MVLGHLYSLRSAGVATILFVHGTGVREAGYRETYKLIAPRIRELGYAPAECLWGDDYGSQFGGAALPSYASEQERQNLAMWRMLLQDPFAELRLLEAAPNASGLASHGEVVWERLLADTPGEITYGRLRALELDPFWPFVFEQLTKQPQRRWEALVKRAAQNDGQFELALSHCLVAQLIRGAEEQWMPPPESADRDSLVQSITTDLGGSPRGFVGDALKMAMGLFTPVATPILRWTRDAWSVGISPAIGDILMYQARGENIRGYIKKQIEAQEGAVVVLAHSLGGIASVDLLLMTEVPQVRALVTVGSQSPYLYEINGLNGLEKGKQWPETFPKKWLNIYDANDFLSYPGEGILPNRVKDFCSRSHQPFPESHSAYWRSANVWKEIAKFLE